MGAPNYRWVFLAGLAALLHAASFLGCGPVDDDFIAQRYASHLAEGYGFAFNVGAGPEEGFSCPLWVLGLALGALGGVSLEGLSVALSLLGCALAAAATAAAWGATGATGATGSGRTVAVPALLLAASPAFAWHGVAGLGTTVLAALLACFAWTELAPVRGPGTRWGGAVALALACLLRQECALFAGPYVWREVRARRFLTACLPLLALVAWTALRLVWFGRWLPLPYYVKRLPLSDELAYGVAYLGRTTLETGIGVLVLLALCAPRAGAGEDGEGDRPARTGVLRLGLALHTAYVVLVGGDFVPWSRFFVPTLPVAWLLACLALAPRLAARPGLGRALFALGLLAPQWLQLGWTIHGRPQRCGEHVFFEDRWAALGHGLAEVVPSGESVAISPIGVFGVAFGGPLVDILGLTNEDVLGVEPDLAIRMKGHHRSNADAVLAARPAAIVVGNGVTQPDGGLVVNPWERTLFEHPELATRYRLVRLPLPGTYPWVGYWRADLAVPAGGQLLR